MPCRVEICPVQEKVAFVVEAGINPENAGEPSNLPDLLQLSSQTLAQRADERVVHASAAGANVLSAQQQHRVQTHEHASAAGANVLSARQQHRVQTHEHASAAGANVLSAQQQHRVQAHEPFMSFHTTDAVRILTGGGMVVEQVRSVLL
eukprot:COSAG02_NODE_163_length_32424_cov_21.759010_17_plen_149_part_00